MKSSITFEPGSQAFILANEAAQKFQKWREEHRTGYKKIPEELWEIAVRLAEITSISKTASFLGLSYYSLKKQVLKKNEISSEFSIPIKGFIEAVMDTNTPTLLAEIIAPSGFSLRIFSPNTNEIIRAFIQR